MGNDGRDEDAKKAYEGVLNIEQKFGTAKKTGEKVQRFLERVKKRMREPPFNIEIPENRTVWNNVRAVCHPRAIQLICFQY